MDAVLTELEGSCSHSSQEARPVNRWLWSLNTSHVITVDGFYVESNI